MRKYKSKKLAAWDFAWSHISGIAGIGETEPTEAQAFLCNVLERLYEMSIPSGAIETMALAIDAAYRIGKERAGG